MGNTPRIEQTVATHSRNEMIDITRRISQLVSQQGVRSGLAVVYVPHTTAAVTINENADPDVREDMLRKLEELIPQRERSYQHGEGNSDSHGKASLTGNSIMVLIEEGALQQWQWQGISLSAFEAPRARQRAV